MQQKLRHGIHRRGLVSSLDGLGDPTPTGLTVRYAITCRPSGALLCLVYAACYKHIAPLGLNAAMRRNLRHCLHRRGLVSSPDGLGAPPPTGLTVRYAITCRPSGALRCLVHAACYKHIAPLGLSAAKFKARSPSWGLGFQAQRVGCPTPYGFNRALCYHLSPLWGFGIFGVCRVL